MSRVVKIWETLTRLRACQNDILPERKIELQSKGIYLGKLDYVMGARLGTNEYAEALAKSEKAIFGIKYTTQRCQEAWHTAHARPIKREWARKHREKERKCRK